MNIKVLKKYLILLISVQLFSTLCYKSYATELDDKNIEEENKINDTFCDYSYDFVGSANTNSNKCSSSKSNNNDAGSNVDYKKIIHENQKSNIIKYFGSVDRYIEILKLFYKMYVGFLKGSITGTTINNINLLLNGDAVISGKLGKETICGSESSNEIVSMLFWVVSSFLRFLSSCHSKYTILYEYGGEKKTIGDEEIIRMALVSNPSSNDYEKDSFFQTLVRIASKKSSKEEIKKLKESVFKAVDELVEKLDGNKCDSYSYKAVKIRSCNIDEFFTKFLPKKIRFQNHNKKKEESPISYKLEEILNVILYSCISDDFFYSSKLLLSKLNSNEASEGKLSDYLDIRNARLAGQSLLSYKFSPVYENFAKSIKNFAEKHGYKEDVQILRNIDSFIFVYSNNETHVPVVVTKSSNAGCSFFVKRANEFYVLNALEREIQGSSIKEKVELEEDRYGLIIKLKYSKNDELPGILEELAKIFNANVYINGDNIFAVIYIQDNSTENGPEKYFAKELKLLNEHLFANLKYNDPKENNNNVSDSDIKKLNENNNDENHEDIDAKIINDYNKENFFVRLDSKGNKVYADSYMELYYPLGDLKAKFKDIFDISGERFYEKYYKPLQDKDKFGAIGFSFRMDDEYYYKDELINMSNEELVGDECFVIKVYIDDDDHKRYNNRDVSVLKDKLLKFINDDVLPKLVNGGEKREYYKVKYSLTEFKNSLLSHIKEWSPEKIRIWYLKELSRLRILATNCCDEIYFTGKYSGEVDYHYISFFEKLQKIFPKYKGDWRLKKFKRDRKDFKSEFEEIFDRCKNDLPPSVTEECNINQSLSMESCLPVADLERYLHETRDLLLEPGYGIANWRSIELNEIVTEILNRYRDRYFAKEEIDGLHEINNNFYYLNRFSEIAENVNSVEDLDKFKNPILKHQYYRCGRHKFIDLMKRSFCKTGKPISDSYFDIGDDNDPSNAKYNDCLISPFANIDKSIYKNKDGKVETIFNKFVSKGPKSIVFRDYIQKNF